METVERMVKSVFNAFGLDIVRSQKVDCPFLPLPSGAIIERAIAYFSDSFPIAPGVGISQEEAEKSFGCYEWFYPFEFGGMHVPYDLQKVDEVRDRHYRRYAHVFAALLSMTGGSLAGNKVLDIGCNAGFWSIQASRAGANNVLGIDASPKNIEQAQFVSRLIDLKNVDYQVMNAYDMSNKLLDTFDITLFIGILYHLDKPKEALERLYDVTGKFAVVDTALSNLQLPLLRLQEDDVSYYHNQSHANSFALIPSEAAVPVLLKSAGFREVYRVPNATDKLPKPYLTNKWRTFIAIK
ncbi:MAG TPA: class I SAM-dependent methyltransferase [Roseiflexaceae bacterium]|nr:class I SAM-dependent methyltransferase [Roseiflexaceae bacterium]